MPAANSRKENLHRSAYAGLGYIFKVQDILRIKRIGTAACYQSSVVLWRTAIMRRRESPK